MGTTRRTRSVPWRRRMISVKVRTVAMDQQMNPVVLLVDQAESLALPIWIGQSEAQSIALELRGQKMPRPMTHDLMRTMLTHLTVSVSRIVVTDLQNGTYFAEIHLRTKNAEVIVDSRPSDAIALALRAEAPIFVEEQGRGRGDPAQEGVRRARGRGVQEVYRPGAARGLRPDAGRRHPPEGQQARGIVVREGGPPTPSPRRPRAPACAPSYTRRRRRRETPRRARPPRGARTVRAESSH